jgi:hypothetical protein
MAGNGIDIQYQAPDYIKFYKAVKSVDIETQKALRKRLSNIAKPIVEEVRQAALSLPSKNGQSHRGQRGEGGLGLRAGLAAATQTKINATNGRRGFSIRIRLSGTAFEAKTGKSITLPRYIEFGKVKGRIWRHPVFADKGATGGSWKGAWTEQKKTPFLLKTVIPHKDEVRDEVAKAFIDAMVETKLVN